MLRRMSGDDLTIATFFLSLAATFGTAVMSLVGWRHKAIIAALFAAALAALTLGLAWPLVREAAPRFGAAVAEVATSGVAWFVIVMFGLLVSLLAGPSRRSAKLVGDAQAALRKDLADAKTALRAEADAMREENTARFEMIRKTAEHAMEQSRRGRGSPAEDATDEVPAPVGPNLYVGRVDVDTNRLASDLLLEFAFVAFNGNAEPLRLAGLRGRIAYGGTLAAPRATPKPLPTPALRADNTSSFGASSEFLIVVSQNVERALAEEIGRDLSAGNVVVFVLEELDALLTAVAAADIEPARLPVWNRVTCERSEGRIFTGRLAMMSGHTTLA